MKKISQWLAIVIIVSALAGCSCRDAIRNFNTHIGTEHTTTEVKSAIFKAGAKNLWVLNEKSPGVITAIRRNHDYYAEIRIKYTATSYSIDYTDSINLHAKRGKISRDYNRWVASLNNDINANLH
ncbi:hypothetical protein PT300_13815 [Enterobacteriaceae bacterium ESL0689]|nr:hypothetical protein [Enterobacteriaceae bacterium ESL0689]